MPLAHRPVACDINALNCGTDTPHCKSAGSNAATNVFDLTLLFASHCTPAKFAQTVHDDVSNDAVGWWAGAGQQIRFG